MALTVRRYASASFGDLSVVIPVLHYLGSFGTSQTLSYIQHNLLHLLPTSPLLTELFLRLQSTPSPTILIDGIWLSNAYGGISTVWSNILSFFSLLPTNSLTPPFLLVDRGIHSRFVHSLPTITAPPTDLLNPTDISTASNWISAFLESHHFDIFVSTWITSAASNKRTKSIAIVHDCIPERLFSSTYSLLSNRRTWIESSDSLLAVSQSTSNDVQRYFPFRSNPHWIYPSPTPLFFKPSTSSLPSRFPPKYVLLPSSSSIGSYKNPELVLNALQHPSLSDVHLVLTGFTSLSIAQSIQDRWPYLSSRIHPYVLDESQLITAYTKALCVVIPSRLEGFGLPVVESLLVDAFVIVADSDGLRESGGSACPRVHCDTPTTLASWFLLASDPQSRRWYLNMTKHNRLHHLNNIHPYLLGLALLSLARSITSISYE